MTIVDFYILSILIISYGIYKTIKFNQDQIGLFIIRRDYKKSLFEEGTEIHAEINIEIEKLLTIENINKFGFLDLRIKVLELINKKSDITEFYIDCYSRVEASLDRLSKYNYPVKHAIDYLMGIVDSIMNENITLLEKDKLFLKVIERGEVIMFLMKYIPHHMNDKEFNFTEEYLDIKKIKNLSNNELLFINKVIAVYHDKNIDYTIKLDLYEEFAMTILTDNFNL